MEDTSTSRNLPEAWKTEFAKRRPLIYVILLLVVALGIIVAACFGHIKFGTPWWSGGMFLISGTILLILVLMKQTFFWEKSAFITIILGTVIGMVAILLYTLEFALATLSQSPFTPHGLSNTEFVLHYKMITAVLALTSFDIGICCGIINILVKARKILTH